ncbi:DUF2244 domain-containing protein [Hyphomonas johnsonii]|uniref:DUF2244 domain-containing protein n=1 Tax=Hyphomonas johnsonii MHS-2 TaxID=1280950 RepID=A0A059FVJ7_9PROT|nr:DUF2244 domain-containing protein [Hyphomonas johnsonii]KCZ94617.1 hypothetical protein HJO_04545 [Hyphomonas johnsonii MHS-2]
MAEQGDIIYFDAVLTPNRSMSQRAFTIVMLVVGCVSFINGMLFASMGALPVVGFYGLDALAIYVAFRWSFRRQREETRVTVSARTLTLEHHKADGTTKRAEIPSAFARVALDEPLLPSSWLRIEHGRTAYVIGRFLTLPERKSLAQALRAALINARSERYPS